MEGRLLIVDDEPGMRDLLAWELENAGLEVTAVGSGNEALERLRLAEFDVVISDVRMPGMSGLDVLRAIHELSPGTETIVMTAYAALETAVECVRGGAFDFLQKPFEVDSLLTTVARALERRKLQSAASLFEASQAVLSNDDPTTLPGVIVDVTMRVMGADDASLMLTSCDDTLYVAESRGLDPEARAAVVAIGERVAGRVAASREPVVIESSLAGDSRFSDIASHRRVRSSIVYPLVSGGHLVGLLNINRVKNPRSYRSCDLERASVLASQILLALENRRLLQTMAVSERLAAIGQVAAGVAHEINNPLACVLANQDYIRTVLEELTGLVGRAGTQGVPDLLALLNDVTEALADAQKGAAHVREIVRDVQALARGDDTPTEVDVNDAIRSALRVASPMLNSCMTVTMDLGRDARVLANEGRLSQVFVNLFVNAAQAMEQPERSGEIRVASSRQRDRVVVEVSDTGPGISPENLARLFEPFFTTKSPGAGTGLGLSISRDIVMRFGGELTAASTVGRGATFTVSLPAADSAAADAGDGRDGRPAAWTQSDLRVVGE